MNVPIITVSPNDLGCENSLLRQKSELVDKITPSIKEIVSQMINAMYSFSYGTGFSAIQMGIPFRLFVVNLCRIPGEEIIAINPVVKSITGRYINRREGCLCLPNYIGEVRRKNNISIEAINLKGEDFVYHAKGYESAVIQHELDHLEGILFWDRMKDGKNPKLIEKL